MKKTTIGLFVGASILTGVFFANDGAADTTVKVNEDGTAEVTKLVQTDDFLKSLDEEIAVIQSGIDELTAKKFVKGTQIITLDQEISALNLEIAELEAKKAERQEIKDKF